MSKFLIDLFFNYPNLSLRLRSSGLRSTGLRSTGVSPSIKIIISSIYQGTVIGTVLAQDGDNGLHWVMTYSIVPDGESESFFACNSTTGEVTLIRALGYETKSQFMIIIQV